MSSIPELARRRGLLLVAGFALLVAAVASGVALARDDDPAAPLTVTWDGTEARPGCVYRPESRTVAVRLRMDGRSPRSREVSVTVTAFADENTSVPVGSASRSVHVEGTVHRRLLLIIPVTRAPHVDIDGVAACKLAVG